MFHFEIRSNWDWDPYALHTTLFKSYFEVADKIP